MESLVMPIDWSDFPERSRKLFGDFRSAAGEDLILQANTFIERVLPGSIIRQLSGAEMEEYRRPYQTAGEDRRAMLTWPRQIPIEGDPADVVKIVEDYSNWLSQSNTPKLYIHTEPGGLDKGRPREFCQGWPNQQEITVKGLHFAQEDSSEEIGSALANFVGQLRHQPTQPNENKPKFVRSL